MREAARGSRGRVHGDSRPLAAALGGFVRRGFGLGALALRRTFELLLLIPVVLVALPLWALPWNAAVRTGRFYGRVAAALWPAARRVAMINLRRALGVERAAARRMTSAVFAHLGGAIAEGAQAARRRERLLELELRVEDPELLRRVLEESRPNLFVMAHLGSWELTAALLAARFGERGAAVVRHIDNPFLDRLVRSVRVTSPGQWIEKRGGIATALARLRAGDSVALLLDENGGRRGIFVDFFGRPASTHRSAALLAMLSGARVLVGGVVRDARSGERLFRLAEIERAPGLDGEAAVRDLTARLTARFETWIREAPEQWRWIHWRWRERPDGTSERYGRSELRAAFAAPMSADAAGGASTSAARRC